MSQTIEESADIFGKQMRKGFISALILLVLTKEPCHGYKIIQEISDLTHEVWKPSYGTVYTLLKSLGKKGFLQLKEVVCTGKRKQKVYEITENGSNMLKILVKEQQEIISSLRTIIVSAFGIDSPIPIDTVQYIIPDHPLFGWANGISYDEKISNIHSIKETLKEEILNLQELDKFLDEELENVKSLDK